MEHVVTNMDDEILVKIGLLGQIRSNKNYRLFSDKEHEFEYYKKRKNRLIANGYLSNRVNGYIRLRQKGYDTLEGLHPELVAVAELHKFKSGDAENEKAVLRGDVTKLFYDFGYFINLIKVIKKNNVFGVLDDSEKASTGKSVLNEDKSFITIQQLFSLIEKTEGYYFTYDFFKYLDDFFVFGNNTAGKTSISGILCKNEFTYAIYTPADITSSVNYFGEQKTLGRVLTYHEWAYGKEARYNKNENEAIVFLEDLSVVPEMLKRTKGFNPTKFLNQYYIIPTKHAELPIKILTTPNHREIIKALIYDTKKSEINEAHDGMIADIKSYEFLSCNYSKIEDIKKDGTPAHIVCYSWQAESIRNCIPQRIDLDFYVIPDEISDRLKKYFK